MNYAITLRNFRTLVRLGLGAGLMALLAVRVAASTSSAVPAARNPAMAGDGSWTVAPDAPFGFNRFDAEYSPTTGNVYFLGGVNGDGTLDSTIWSFDPQTGAYADTGADMLTPVANYEIVRLANAEGVEELLTFGGRIEGGGGNVAVQAYRPATNEVVDYTASDPLAVAMAPGAVVVVDNLAYLFGGFDGNEVFAQTLIFDLTAAAGSRFTPGPNLSLARGYIAGAAADGYLYAIGGDTYDGQHLVATATVERLELANPTAWDDAAVADLPLPCGDVRAFGFDAASDFDLAGAIIVAGCGQWPYQWPEAMLYDVAGDIWDLGFPDLQMSRRNYAAALLPVNESLGHYAMWLWGGRPSDIYAPEYYDVFRLPQITVAKTVSDDGTCGPSDTLEIWIGTEVTYCYTMTNSGGVPVVTHTVDDDKLGLIGGGTLTMTVQPGETVSVTATATPSESVTNTVVWTATTEDGRSASATDSATVTVLAPSLTVFKGVSDDGTCGTTAVISVEAGTEVTYCYVMTNTGNVDLPVHTVEDDRLGIITGGPISQTVVPGNVLSVTATAVITAPVTNTVTWTAVAAGGPPATASASATVQVGSPYWLYLPTVVNAPGGRLGP